MAIKLEYPGYDPQHEIELRNPEEFDTDAVPIDHVIQRARGGQVFTVSDPLDVIISVLAFEHISLDKKQELEDFLINSQGEYYKYTDYEGEEWICKLVDTNWTNSEDFKYDFTLTIHKWEVPDENSP